MTSPIVDIDEDVVRKILNVGAAFAALQVAADVIEKVAFDDDDVQGITWLPIGLQVHTKARILEAAEAIREELREIDAALLTLTAGQHEPA